jgi:hypothetical protein
VTLYPVILAGTPRKLGALKETVACPAPAVAETLVGAPGTISKDGQLDAPLSACADRRSHIPEAELVETVGSLPLTPPLNLLVMLRNLFVTANRLQI